MAVIENIGATEVNFSSITSYYSSLCTTLLLLVECSVSRFQKSLLLLKVFSCSQNLLKFVLVICSLLIVSGLIQNCRTNLTPLIYLTTRLLSSRIFPI